uniref:Bidirectional sugar transporter SWEET n=1 Tax=Paeonia suffruticosa TaxID=45171 RepID=A0A5C1IWI8_PAESU|nr:bidirectional sugar transporter SWEET7 [Paeonia suffruticosa]
MVSTELARTVVGILGNIIAFFLFLSPTPTFVKIWKKGSVEQFSPVPYLATFINCMIWVLYGLPMVTPNSTLVVTINGTGTGIEIVFLTLFIIYSDGRKRLQVIVIAIIEVLFIGAVAILVLTLAHTHERRTLVVGIIACVFNAMMYASPLSVMKMVITTKSVEFMPFFLSFASFANGVAWVSYAVIQFDPFIAIPNGLGTLFSLAQLILYATYYKSTKRMMAARKEKMEVGLTEVTVAGESNKTRNAPHQNGRISEIRNI